MSKKKKKMDKKRSRKSKYHSLKGSYHSPRRGEKCVNSANLVEFTRGAVFTHTLNAYIYIYIYNMQPMFDFFLQ